MIPLLGGAGLLLLLLAAGDAFSRARVPTIKALIAWVVALGGVSLGLLLVLSGRWPAALAALTMFGPLGWNWWQGRHAAAAQRPPPRPAAAGAMTVDDAWAVLGLAPGAPEAAIRAAHLRLMRVSHPDNGGSDWVAARVNQARDLLLARSRRTKM